MFEWGCWFGSYYDSVAKALAEFRQRGEGVVFFDQDVAVIFYKIDV